MRIDLELTIEQAQTVTAFYPADAHYATVGNIALQEICNQIREQTPPSVGDIVHAANGMYPPARKMYVVAIADDIDGTQVWCRDADNVLATYPLATLYPGVGI